MYPVDWSLRMPAWHRHPCNVYYYNLHRRRFNEKSRVLVVSHQPTIRQSRSLTATHFTRSQPLTVKANKRTNERTNERTGKRKRFE